MKFEGIDIHDCTLENISYIAKAPQLKELSLNVVCAEGLSALQKSKTLKSLSVRKVTGMAPEELAGFERLQELSVEDMELHDGAFIGGLKNLKKLYLYWHTLDKKISHRMGISDAILLHNDGRLVKCISQRVNQLLQ